MPLQVIAVALLILAIILAAYGSSREENRHPHLTPGFAVFLAIVFSLLIAGVILLFISAGWKWGLVGLVTSWLMVIIASIIPSVQGRNYVFLFERAKEEGIIGEQHKMEIEDFWKSTSPEKCASLMVSFLDELRHNWSREFYELHPDRRSQAISKELNICIEKAYIAGYMSGKAWMSQEHLADFNLYLGDTLARDVRSSLRKARGTAFASAFAAGAVQGHLAALGQ